MRLNDALLGVLLFGVAIALFLGSRGFPSIPGQQIGAGAFPTVLSAGFALCATILVISGLRSRLPAIVWMDWTREPNGIRNVVVIIALVIFYIAFARQLGFMLTMAPIIFVMLRLFGVGWLASLAIAVIAVLGMQYIFGRFLLVPLPWGLLAPIRWW
ncbi:MAG: tripartite tricarboxylate transporter TctB family protein [Salinarimonas sp.]|nr:tripartite tricarboxylate transporter TctB family protein [Salinarimonas sp.]